jgi:hypothetical protein
MNNPQNPLKRVDLHVPNICMGGQIVWPAPMLESKMWFWGEVFLF